MRDVELNEGVQQREGSAGKIGDKTTFSIYGELCDERFLTFTSLSDEGIHYDHPELNGSFVKLTVERIDASFH